MSEHMSGLNPAVITWARRSAGYSVGELATRLKRDPREVAAWEEGASSPTYAQLEKMAYEVLKRPIAVFFFPEPPDDPDPGGAFRTLPGGEIEALAPGTRYRIRLARAQQLALDELCGGRNPSSRMVTEDLAISEASAWLGLGQRVREYLGVPLATQAQGWTSAEEALDGWRSAIEAVGIFVFKHSIEQEGICGFSLYDERFPIIMINNGSAVTRQIFTLFHELGHLLAHVSGVDKVDDGFVQSLPRDHRRIEVACNRLAADVLAPRDTVVAEVRRRQGEVEAVASDVARLFKVSREVVALRMKDAALVSESTYAALKNKWDGEFRASRERRREASKGGDYYATQATYVSGCAADLAMQAYYRGAVSEERLADYLGVQPKSLDGMERALLRRGAR